MQCPSYPALEQPQESPFAQGVGAGACLVLKGCQAPSLIGDPGTRPQMSLRKGQLQATGHTELEETQMVFT